MLVKQESVGRVGTTIQYVHWIMDDGEGFMSHNNGESKKNLKEKATFLKILIQIRWHMNTPANLEVLFTQYKIVQRCYWTPVRLNGSGLMNHSLC